MDNSTFYTNAKKLQTFYGVSVFLLRHFNFCSSVPILFVFWVIKFLLPVEVGISFWLCNPTSFCGGRQKGVFLYINKFSISCQILIFFSFYSPWQSQLDEPHAPVPISYCYWNMKGWKITTPLFWKLFHFSYDFDVGFFFPNFKKCRNKSSQKACF